MSRSLRGQLVSSLLWTVTPLWLLACAMLAWHAQHEVNELYDGQQQMFARQLYHALPAMSAGRSGPPASESDHQAVAMWDSRGQRLLADNEGMTLHARPGYTGYSTLQHDDESWRVYYLSGPDGHVAVAQEIHERWEMLGGLLLTQSLLWLVLLPFALGAVWWAVRHSLQPLAALQQALQARPVDDPTPLARSAPHELLPLIDGMNGLIERVAGTLQRERQFTADAAHELRSPLTALRVQAELLTLLDEPAARDAAARKVMAGVDRASHLVDQLLALSRLEQQTGLPTEPLDWPALVAGVEQSLATEVAARQSTLRCEVAAGPLLQGDATLLQLLLRNLLDNALRYSPPGSDILLHVTPQAILVQDNGPGLPAEWADRIGERFFRPPGQTASGSGLGLSIVRRIARLHGLAVHWGNRPEGGLQVSLQPQAETAAMLDEKRPETS